MRFNKFQNIAIATPATLSIKFAAFHLLLGRNEHLHDDDAHDLLVSRTTTNVTNHTMLNHGVHTKCFAR